MRKSCFVWGNKMTSKITAMPDYSVDSDIILGKLAIDRCKNHVSNLHALIHMFMCDRETVDPAVIESARIIMAGLELDLDCSASVLAKFS